MSVPMRIVIPSVAVLTWLVGCDPRFVAPEGARILLSASPASVVANHDSAVVSFVIQLETGDLIPYDAEVSVSASVGGLCKGSFGDIRCEGDSALGLPAIQLRTRKSAGFLVFRSGTDTGSAVIRARSGDAVDSIVVRVVP